MLLLLFLLTYLVLLVVAMPLAPPHWLGVFQKLGRRSEGHEIDSDLLLGTYERLMANQKRQDSKLDSLKDYKPKLVTNKFKLLPNARPPKDVYQTTLYNLNTLFWDGQAGNWRGKCGQSDDTVVWPVAVALRAVINDGENNKDRFNELQKALNKYKLKEVKGAYSALTNQDTDIYNDDDCQVSWVFTDILGKYQTESLQNDANDLINYLGTQVNHKKGGITWKRGAPYVSSILTLEAALASVRYYEVNKVPSLLTFAIYNLNWIFDNLLEPDTFFIYDGIDADTSDLNKGKLSYTIGTAISTMAYLSKYDTSKNWKAIALGFALKAISNGECDNLFFKTDGSIDGIINNSLDHAHLFYAGLADFLEFTTPETDYEKKSYQLLKDFMQRQVRHLYEKYLNSDIYIGTKCPQNLGKLLDFASLVQVFKEAARVIDSI